MKTIILSAAAFLLGVVVSPLMRTNASAMALPYQGSIVNSQRAIPQVPEVGLTDLTSRNLTATTPCSLTA